MDEQRVVIFPSIINTNCYSHVIIIIVYQTCPYCREKLMDVLKVLVYEIFFETFYEKRKKKKLIFDNFLYL